jgi:uncharacterized protein (DUF1697 family)
MALIVLLRGINVGGHRALRPALLARALAARDAVNIGAAGTLVLRKPGAPARLREELRARLPATTRFVFCEGRDLLRFLETNPFDGRRLAAGNVRFLSVLARGARRPPSLPLTIPHGRDWFVRVTAVSGRLAAGEYRRQMKTIGYLGKLDAVFGTLVTTRSWGTVESIARVLESTRAG